MQVLVVGGFFVFTTWHPLAQWQFGLKAAAISCLTFCQNGWHLFTTADIYRQMEELADIELLRQYAHQKSDEAFAVLVNRHVNLVYSAALRKTNNSHAAEEITQAVFIILAQKAGGLRDGTILSGWLYQATRLTSANFLRTEIRRAHREHEAYMQSIGNETDSNLWLQIAPHLEDAMGKLSEKDRNAITLRFFEGKSFEEVGNAFGASENAAKKRVAYALEKLRKFFVKRRVVSTTAIIAGIVSANSVQAAPALLAKTATAVAVGKGATASGSTLVLVKGALKLMAWAKAQMAIVVGTTTVLVAVTTTVAVKNLDRKATPAPVEAFSSFDEFLSGNLGSGSRFDKAPPALFVRPTRFSHTNSGAIWSAIPNRTTLRAVGRNTSFADLMRVAYGFDETRMVPPNYLPLTNFDYMATLPDCPRKALQDEIEKEVGFVAHPEMREMNVLLLKVKIPDAPGLRPGKATATSTRWLYGGNAYHVTNMPISDLREFLESTIFHQPVMDQTGLTNKYDIYLDWEGARYPDIMLGSLREVLLEQLGLELVPARERIEMLVIEPAKNSAKAAQLKEVSTSSTEASLWNQPNLAHVPPLLILRPTRFDREGLGNDVTYVMGQLRMRLRNQSLEPLLAAACDFNGNGRTDLPSRMILPPNLPRERYDLLLTVPGGLDALRKEIRKQLHVTVRREIREVDALVIKDPEASATEAGTERRATARSPLNSPNAMKNLPLWIIAQNIEAYQGKPVLVKAASTNRFNLSIEPILKNQKLVFDEEQLNRAFHDQLDLQIVPSRERVEMLVVEREKN
jgi:uncharacterized protein (TIGR03435 family)